MPIMEQAQAPGKAPRKTKLPRSRLPVKRSINLAQTNVKRINWLAAFFCTLLIAAAAAAFGKFAVADRFAAVAEARGEVRQLETELAAARAEVESYGELNARYAHYTISDMTEEELSRVDRVEVMKLLRRTVLSSMDLDSWAVGGNVLTISVSGKTLQEINLMTQQLLRDKLVDYCTVSTAETGRDSARTEEDGTVSAVVIVYLKSEEAEGK